MATSVGRQMEEEFLRSVEERKKTPTSYTPRDTTVIPVSSQQQVSTIDKQPPPPTTIPPSSTIVHVKPATTEPLFVTQALKAQALATKIVLGGERINTSKQTTLNFAPTSSSSTMTDTNTIAEELTQAMEQEEEEPTTPIIQPKRKADASAFFSTEAAATTNRKKRKIDDSEEEEEEEDEEKAKEEFKDFLVEEEEEEEEQTDDGHAQHIIATREMDGNPNMKRLKKRSSQPPSDYVPDEEDAKAAEVAVDEHGETLKPLPPLPPKEVTFAPLPDKVKETSKPKVNPKPKSKPKEPKEPKEASPKPKPKSKPRPRSKPKPKSMKEASLAGCTGATTNEDRLKQWCDELPQAFSYDSTVKDACYTLSCLLKRTATDPEHAVIAQKIMDAVALVTDFHGFTSAWILDSDAVPKQAIQNILARIVDEFNGANGHFMHVAFTLFLNGKPFYEQRGSPPMTFLELYKKVTQETSQRKPQDNTVRALINAYRPPHPSSSNHA